MSHFQGIALTTDVGTIKNLLPSYSQELIKGLIIDRRGVEEGSNMTAWGLHQAVNDKQLFKIDGEKGLVPVLDADRVRRLPLVLSKSEKPPAHAVVMAVWDKSVAKGGEGNNILGDNGTFHVNEDVLEIPVVPATDEALSYYGATILNAGETVLFPQLYPIWAMSLGEHYVEKCLMSEARGGFYVEYHHDQPHFHMPLSSDAGGHYILGREVAQGVFHFTGFNIPCGTAVYTSGGAIHCDAALTGEKWVVGYAPAVDFSTVNVRGMSGKMTMISPRKREPKCTVM